MEGRESRKICQKKKQLGDREGEKNQFWTISNKLVTTEPGDSSCLSPHVDTHEHTHAHVCTHIHAHSHKHTSLPHQQWTFGLSDQM